VGSLVFSSPPDIQFNIPHAVKELSKAWGGRIGIEEMYNAVEKSLDLQKTKVVKIMDAFQRARIDSLETVEAAIDSRVASREEIIGCAVIMYANQNFGSGEYPDCRAVFERARKMWGDSAPKFDELHEAFITATTRNPRQRNIRLGQILLEVQDRLTKENFDAELKARPQVKNIITIAGYLHTGGLSPTLESLGYKKTK